MYKILIIEDDNIVIQYYKNLFKNKEGLELHIASGIKDAFLKVQKVQFFLIVSDFVMPNFETMATVDLFKYIKTTPLNSKVPIFVVTANKGMAEDEIDDPTITIFNKDQKTGEDLAKFLQQIILESKKNKKKEGLFVENGKVKSNVTKIFQDSAIKVFKTMANLTIKPLDSCENCRIRNVDISTTFGISSDNIRGALSLSLSESIFLKVVSSMFQEEVTEVNSDNEAAIAELINIILGASKRELKLLDENNIDLAMGVPVVIKGECHELTNLGSFAKIIMPFDVDGSKIFFSLSILE